MKYNELTLTSNKKAKRVGRGIAAGHAVRRLVGEAVRTDVAWRRCITERSSGIQAKHAVQRAAHESGAQRKTVVLCVI